ncbi:MAG: TIM-barrel domain-containing protein [Saprospiraceae bacterium]
MRLLACLIFTIFCLNNSFSQNVKDIELDIMTDEYWWGGLSTLGHQTPYDDSSVFSKDQWGDNVGNQAQPLLISNKGRYIWSEEPIKYSFNQGKLKVSVREGHIISGEAGKNLKSAYHYVVENFFPPNKKIPAEIMFTHPQYNTWIELTYNQNEEDILNYAQAIIDNGYPPGVLMIDDNWQEDYGVWKFSPRRFKDPKGMVKKLHAMGFKVMLWICPFVSPDSPTYREIAEKGMLVLDPQKEQDILWANTNKKAAIIRWWKWCECLCRFE